MDNETAHQKHSVQDILRALEGDAPLVVPAVREYWADYLQNHSRRYVDALSFIERYGKGSKILEIGSVPGQFTVLLKQLGYDVRGVDINPERCDALWKKYAIEVSKADIETQGLSYPQEHFDVVLFLEVLEHLRINPLQAIGEVHRVLRPGGTLILSTPNITPKMRLGFLLGIDHQGDPVEEFTKLDDIGNMGHFRLYFLKEVERMLEHAGFRKMSHAYIGDEHKAEGWKQKLFFLAGRVFFGFRNEQFRDTLYVVAQKQ